MEQDIGEKIIGKLQEILTETKKTNRKEIDNANPQDVSNQISNTLEEMTMKLRFMIEEIDYQIKAIKDGKQKH